MPCATLECHSAGRCDALRGIEASVTRSAGGLRVAYVIEGELAGLRIPPPRPPRVAERLWQHTCCELFVARAGAAGYREFNFSPSGEWAQYEFERYRQGALRAGADPGIAVRQDARRRELTASIAIEPHDRLRIGLCAVIEEQGGALSYWALAHAPGKPDFHHPDAFALELDEFRH
jgi:hypothetical protein